MSPRITPLVLAGGAGTRLWPVSRDTMPKQFLSLVGNKTTYQQTLLRVADPNIFADPIVMTRSDFHFFAQRQAEDIGIKATIAIEPIRRDSAAAIAAGTLIAKQQDPEAIVLALAADHIILDIDLFREACLSAREGAMLGRIVTFGIQPTEPKTSYGYILRGKELAADVHAVAKFVEKPDVATAAGYVTHGYLWNSGNFMFKADVLLGELARFEPEMMAAVEEAVRDSHNDLGFMRLEPNAFAKAPQKSIDYAVMEKTQLAAVVGGRFRWSDIGSWDAVFDVTERDAAGNALHGRAVTVDCENCVVHSGDGRLTTVLGGKDLVVVSTTDAVLVMPRARAEQVKDLVGKLRESNRSEAVTHRLVHRPWGTYDSIDMGDRFQVKRIVVRPGGVLSLQKHLHRAEHWVVVRGTAEVTRDNIRQDVHENESVYIQIGTVHRLANRGKIPLELIEVQTGSYLGEDDIIRLEDIYQRT